MGRIMEHYLVYREREKYILQKFDKAEMDFIECANYECVEILPSSTDGEYIFALVE